MSHIVTLDIELRDLDAIEAAAKRLGLEFHLDQKTYRWYGQKLNHYALPEGMTDDDLGKCEHAITLSADHPDIATAYEIGVVKQGDHFTLAFDFWGSRISGQQFIGGIPISEIVGADLGAFKQAYGVELAKRELQLEGWMVNEILATDGSIELVATQ